MYIFNVDNHYQIVSPVHQSVPLFPKELRMDSMILIMSDLNSFHNI